MSSVDMRYRAERGAALLDATRPHWYEGVSVTALNQANGDVCVLGQIYGVYEAGLTALFPSPATYTTEHSGTPNLDSTSDFYGFSAFDVSAPLDMDPWLRLTQAWRDIIADRRCQAMQAWRDVVAERRSRALDLDLSEQVHEKVSVSV